MKAEARFSKLPKSFWANVRSISEKNGYTARNQGTIKVPTLKDVLDALSDLELRTDKVSADSKNPTAFGRQLLDYFAYRAEILNNFVHPRLMDAKAAKLLFERLKAKHNPPKSIVPMNKQKGKKKAPAYLTAIVNMLIKSNAKGIDCDYDPRALTTVTKDGQPLRTLARRVDGAFPAIVNPVAVWEIKEYYYTTTFGSRVADGVYESLLDGMELEELREHEGVDVKHYLIVDARFTWWECGRSYLCRIIDMLHMGYIDEAIFGSEVVERIPILVEEWLKLAAVRRGSSRIAGEGVEPRPEGSVG